MKKLLLLSGIILLAIGLQAQRNGDVSVTMHQPADNANIKGTDVFDVQFTGYNLGPTMIKANDSFIVGLAFNGNPLSNFTSLLKFAKDLAIGDSIPMKIQNLKFNISQDMTGPLCGIISVFNRGTDSYTDTSVTNNSGCSNINLLNNVGIGEFNGPIIDFVKPHVYPNPSNGNFMISFGLSSLENVNVSIFDLQGRMVMEVVNESRNPGAFIENIYTGSLLPGVYIVTLKTGQFTRSTKVVVTE